MAKKGDGSGGFVNVYINGYEFGIARGGVFDKDMNEVDLDTPIILPSSIEWTVTFPVCFLCMVELGAFSIRDWKMDVGDVSIGLCKEHDEWARSFIENYKKGGA